MRPRHRSSSAPLLALAWLAACGAGRAERAGEPAREAKQPPADAAVEPYTYPAPVKGHYAEVNTGDFDLVDGLAYKTAAGTVVYATSKPIASPLLSADCPMSEARALTALRDAGWLEVTLDERGRSDYFGAGTPFAGRSREQEVGGRYWTTHVDLRGGKAVGAAKHRQHGGFEFELPLRQPGRVQISENDEFSAVRGDPAAPEPAEAAVRAAYQSIHQAIQARDLGAALTVQGFSPQLVAGVRGLAGIDADLAVFADRFLDPGAPGETQMENGYGGIGASGKNSKGQPFFNFYQFESCGDRLILVGVGENPQ